MPCWQGRGCSLKKLKQGVKEGKDLMLYSAAELSEEAEDMMAAVTLHYLQAKHD